MVLKIKKRKSADKSMTKKKRNYRFKSGFAEKAKERSRKTYRSGKGKEFELQGNVVLTSLKFVDDEAKVFPVFNQLNNRTEHMPVLRLMYAAKLLNVSYQSLWRWTSETQQVPMPVLVDMSSSREYAVYHLEEVKIILRIIGDHLTRFKYYRSDHEAPKRQLFAEIEALRARNFNTTIGEPNGDQEERPHTRRKGKGRRTRNHK